MPLHECEEPQDLKAFDLQGHRGAWGLVPLNTLHPFAEAIAIGVTTVELDVGVSKDGHVVVSHDRHLATRMYRETGPLDACDPQYPYVGRRIAELTLTQLRKVTCVIQSGGPASPLPDGRLDPGLPREIPTLSEVFELSWRMGAHSLRFNVEAKLHPGRPGETLTRDEFVQRLVDTIRGARMSDRVMLSSFDWSALQRVRESMPEVQLAALVTPGYRRGKRIPWTAGIDVEGAPFHGDLAAAAHSVGATALCINWRNATDVIIRSAHRRGMRILAWTVNSQEVMAQLIDDGIDGIVTDFPDRLSQVMSRKGLGLPQPPRIIPIRAPAA